MILGADLFFALFNNLAIFIGLVGVYGYLIFQHKKSPWYMRLLLLGLVFGMFAISCMCAKIPIFKGVIVDQRNAIIALSGFFGGPIAAYLSAAVAGAFRLFLGGQGGFAGDIGVSLAAASALWINTKGCNQRVPGENLHSPRFPFCQRFPDRFVIIKTKE